MDSKGDSSAQSVSIVETWRHPNLPEGDTKYDPDKLSTSHRSANRGEELEKFFNGISKIPKQLKFQCKTHSDPNIDLSEDSCYPVINGSIYKYIPGKTVLYDTVYGLYLPEHAVRKQILNTLYSYKATFGKSFEAVSSSLYDHDLMYQCRTLHTAHVIRNAKSIYEDMSCGENTTSNRKIGETFDQSQLCGEVSSKFDEKSITLTLQTHDIADRNKDVRKTSLILGSDQSVYLHFEDDSSERMELVPPGGVILHPAPEQVHDP
ncbi:uncharacterized protein I206_100047 [Kwoniella pini CBS 10737]|uniref:Uncharacterized protein n=1 Tax=Kwoniella pini CBS 10737 TaxID=1296096 RepID=A0A1B9HSD8_9TREE|nr:uncharacterized protein I206_07862 [Kwoniella pini CBS 10737]OCF46192.1 hypothetical protein I206_07862 [Kwoniella pini CBS 10737]